MQNSTSSLLPGYDYFYLPTVNADTLESSGSLDIKVNGNVVASFNAAGITTNNALTNTLMIDPANNRIYKKTAKSYGQIFNTSLNTSATATAITGAYYTVNISGTNITAANDFSANTTGILTYIGTVAKPFFINYSATVVAASALLFGIRLTVNNSTVPGTECRGSVSNGARSDNISSHIIYVLNPNDAIALTVANLSSTISTTVQWYDISCIEI
jgi:hypothetical protein